MMMTMIVTISIVVTDERFVSSTDSRILLREVPVIEYVRRVVETVHV